LGAQARCCAEQREWEVVSLHRHATSGPVGLMPCGGWPALARPSLLAPASALIILQGTNATWPSPWPSEGFGEGLSQARRCSGRGRRMASAASHEPTEASRHPQTSMRWVLRGHASTTDSRSCCIACLCAVASGPGVHEALSRAKVSTKWSAWKPGSALLLMDAAVLYCTALYHAIYMYLWVRVPV
jgi:hypothetical protein